VSQEPNNRCDFLVVGAGYAGTVLARLIAEELDQKVIVVDKRSHIAGNAYDYIDKQTNITLHKYGPHLFHTNNEEVWKFLSRFTSWQPFEHRVRANIDGQTYPIPINIDTVNKLYGTDYTPDTIDQFYQKTRQDRPINNSEDSTIAKIGHDLYEKFFKNYTKKQWDLYPNELDRSVLDRIPVRTNHDDRYFTDKYQALPKDGYTAMFQRMLDHPKISVRLNTEYKDIKDSIEHKELIYSGCIDEFFDYCLGKLPYRSLEFKQEKLPIEQFQEVLQVNYPNHEEYTRILEYKHLSQNPTKDSTIIVKEYSKALGEPYYPIPRPQNRALYQQYLELATQQYPHVHFIGRLAEYKYYNQDRVVESALGYFKEKISPKYEENKNCSLLS